MGNCINLNERFGNRYRISYDPAFVAEHGAIVALTTPGCKSSPDARDTFTPTARICSR